MSDNMSNSILKKLSKIVLNFELSSLIATFMSAKAASSSSAKAPLWGAIEDHRVRLMRVSILN
jgi:hypothetical protein